MQASGYPSVQQNQTALMTKFMQKFTVQNKLRSDFAFLASYSAQRCTVRGVNLSPRNSAICTAQIID